MKKTKKVISLLLAITMILSLLIGFSVSTFAADDNIFISGDYKYRLLDDNTAEITWYNGKYDSKVEKLVIPDKIDGYTVTSLGRRSFCDSRLKIIKIPKTVTNIGFQAFSSDWLVDIEIPSSVTTIEEEAFMHCSSLTNISIPSSVTNIGGSLFSGCVRLEKITVHKDNPVYDSRNNCNAVIETKTNTLISGCMSTKIPNTVTVIGDNSFSWLDLTSIKIPNGITVIGQGAFYECSELTDIVLPNTVTIIDDYAFQCCDSLKSCQIPNSVTNIGFNAFIGCKSLSDIIIPDSVTVIQTDAFEYCTSLTDITVLSKDCIICDSEPSGYIGNGNTLGGTATIHGFKNSTVQKYADKHNRNFVALEDEPIISDGTDIEYIIGSNSNVSIHCVYHLNDFVSVEINGILVDKANYTLSDGSTVLTFNSDYLDTLKAGSYNVKLNYIYTTVSTALIIKEENTESNQTVSTDTSEKNSSNTTIVNSNNTTKSVKSKNIKSPSTGVPNAVIALSSAFLVSGLAVIISKKKNYCLQK